MVRILCTKQLSITDIQAFTQAGFSIETIDFIQILPFSSFDHISTFEYGIFTSTNALSALIQNPAYQDIPCRKAFCVGEKTQKVLQENGWEVIASFPYASLLASYLVENFPQASMAFFCGDKRLDTLPHTLKEHQIPFQEIQTYQTLLTPKHLETSFEALLFFSPSAVESFLIENTFGSEKIICIGTTTQKALPKGIESFLADTPTLRGMRDSCIRIFKPFLE